jgi:seryl-tRNA synthetase
MMDQDNLLNKLDELYKKINTLEKSVHEQKQPSITIHLDVKDLHLQELKLDELAFHLDKIDIKELSGMLNLGNTFSPSVHRKAKTKTNSPKDKPRKEKRDEIKVNINGKSVPYKID